MEAEGIGVERSAADQPTVIDIDNIPEDRLEEALELKSQGRFDEFDPDKPVGPEDEETEEEEALDEETQDQESSDETETEEVEPSADEESAEETTEEDPLALAQQRIEEKDSLIAKHRSDYSSLVQEKVAAEQANQELQNRIAALEAKSQMSPVVPLEKLRQEFGDEHVESITQIFNTLNAQATQAQQAMATQQHAAQVKQIQETKAFVEGVFPDFVGMVGEIAEIAAKDGQSTAEAIADFKQNPYAARPDILMKYGHQVAMNRLKAGQVKEAKKGSKQAVADKIEAAAKKKSSISNKVSNGSTAASVKFVEKSEAEQDKMTLDELLVYQDRRNKAMKG